MSYQTGKINTTIIKENTSIDLNNCTGVFIQNNGSTTARINNRVLVGGKEMLIAPNFIINDQVMDIIFENDTSRDLLVQKYIVNSSCN